MKILAIRGSQLASLGDFALELDQAPLRDAGVFCIAGPTGAGKSTLLDAMCLALYNRIPRTRTQQSRVRLNAGGDDMLAVSDSRLIIRRGAPSASAEVEFAARGVRYRASWRVERARGRSDGRLQEPRIALLDLTHQQTKTESTNRQTLAVIAQTVGLDFEQFCRSVLLAQGEFAQFLRAQQDERAALLEALTGGEIYSRISIEVYRQHSDAQLALKALVDKHAGLLLKGEDELSAFSSERDGLIQMQGRLREELGALAVQISAQQRAISAQVVLQTARAALRALLEDPRPLDGAIESELALGTAQRDRLLGHASKARLLDGRINDLQAGLALRAKAQAANAEVEHAAQLRRAQVLTTRDRLQSASAAHRAWLDENAYVARWADNQAAILGTLAAARAQAAKATELTRTHAQSSATLASAENKLGELARTQESSREKLLAAQAHKLKASAQLENDHACNPPQLRERALLELNEQQLLLERLSALAHAAAAASFDRARSQDESRQANERLSQAEQNRAQCLLTQQQCALEASTISSDLKTASAAAELALRRPELLHTDQPCPLCGSLEHPALAHPAPVDGMLERLRMLDLSAQQALKSADRQREQTQSDFVIAEVKYKRAEHDANQSELALQLAQQRWMAARSADAPLTPELKSSADWLERSLAEIGKTRERLLAAAQAAHQLNAAAQAAATACDAMQAAFDRLARESADLTRALSKANSDQQAAATELALANARLEQHCEALDEPLSALPDWRSALKSADNRLHEQISALVEQWRHQQAAIGQNQSEQLGLAQTLTALDTELTVAASTIAEIDAALGREQGDLLAKVSERSALANGLAALRIEANAQALTEQLALTENARSAAVSSQTQAPQTALAALELSQRNAQLASEENAKRYGALDAELKADAKQRGAARALTAQITEQQSSADQWAQLNGLIGSADGKKFRVYAQNHTLDALLAATNGYLLKLRPRYALKRLLAHDMEIAVLDREAGDELRSVHSLSGGETFLVSLALALGLSTLSAQHVEIESLFIDEGFAALDPSALEDTLELLDRLRAEGRQVGVISHIPELNERLQACVLVEPQTLGLSRVSIRL